MKRLSLLLSLFAFSVHASAQTGTENVLKVRQTDALTENLVVPSGRTLTINAGGSIINNGTATGFSPTLTIGTSVITGGTHGHVLFNNNGVLGGVDLAATYQTLTGTLALANFASITGTLGGANIADGAITTAKLATLSSFKLLSASPSPSELTINSQGMTSAATLTIQAANNPILSLGRSFYVSPSGGSVTITGHASNSSVTLPQTGTLIGTSDVGAVTNTMLANSSITVNGSAIALGGSVTTAVLGPNTFTGAQSVSVNGAASTPPLSLTGTIFTGGTATTTKPSLLVEPSGTTSNNWSTSGTLLGVNAPSGFTGNLIDAQVNGTNRFRVDRNGTILMRYFGNNIMIYDDDGTTLRCYTSIGRWFATDFCTMDNTATLGADGLGGLRLGSARPIAWSNSSQWFVGAYDLFVRRGAAATLQLGENAAAPVAQTIQAHAGTGTNISGASLTVQGGASTGTGNGGDVIQRTSMTGSSGSSVNSYQTRLQVVGKFVNLTESTATNLVSIALASGRVVGGTATVTVWASDGTDHQALTSQVRVDAVNKAGTITVQVTQTDNTAAVSAGTLTCTYDATASGNNLLLRANAVSSLTQTTLRARIVITALNGDDVQTVTPQ